MNNGSHSSRNVRWLSLLLCDTQQADSTKQSYLTSATVESPSVTVCALPQEALRNFINHLNLTSASSFDNLPKGSPSLFCDVSVSNNGQLFSNAQTYNVFDSVCYNCQSASCTQKVFRCSYNVQRFDSVKTITNYLYLYVFTRIHALVIGAGWDLPGVGVGRVRPTIL